MCERSPPSPYNVWLPITHNKHVSDSAASAGMEGQQYIIQQQKEEEGGLREGELREQDRFLLATLSPCHPVLTTFPPVHLTT